MSRTRLRVFFILCVLASPGWSQSAKKSAVHANETIINFLKVFLDKGIVAVKQSSVTTDGVGIRPRRGYARIDQDSDSDSSSSSERYSREFPNQTLSPPTSVKAESVIFEAGPNKRTESDDHLNYRIDEVNASVEFRICHQLNESDLEGLYSNSPRLPKESSSDCAVLASTVKAVRYFDGAQKLLVEAKTPYQPKPSVTKIAVTQALLSVNVVPPAEENGDTTLAMGLEHGCLRRNGAVYCWGMNNGGVLGDGSTVSSPRVAVEVINLDAGALQVSGHYRTNCALNSDGIHCWGVRGYLPFGQTDLLGVGVVELHQPELIPGTVGAEHLAVGTNNACFIRGGGVYCWGLNQGVMGTAIPLNSRTPTPTLVPGLESGVSQIHVASAHICAIQNGDVVCQGYNAYGYLGRGYSGGIELNVEKVSGLSNGEAIAVRTGSYNSCALTIGGAVKCWGRSGGIGDGVFRSRSVATPVQDMDSGVTQISVGTQMACAVKDEQAYCWGRNVSGRLGTPLIPIDAFAHSPVLVSTSGPVEMVEAEQDQMCAVLKSGAVECFGAGYGASAVSIDLSVVR